MKVTPYIAKMKDFGTCLLSVQINITSSCINKCKHCGKNTWEKQQLSIEDIKSVANDLKELGVKSIILSGGEPFLHQDIYTIIEMLVSDFEVGIFTSGAVSIDPGKVEKVSWIRFSLDASNDELYRDVRGSDSFQTVVDNIKNINIDKRINYTVSKLNEKDVESMAEFAKLLNVKIKFFLTSFSDDDMNTEELQWLYNRLFFNKNEPILSFLTKLQNVLYCNGHKNCVAPKFHCIINSDGNIYPCCYGMGDVLSREKRIENETENAVIGSIKNGFLNEWLDFSLDMKDKEFFEDDCDYIEKCYRYRKINQEYQDFLKEKPSNFI